MFSTSTRQLLPRRLQLLQFPARQCRCYGDGVTRRQHGQRENQQKKQETQEGNQEQEQEQKQNRSLYEKLFLSRRKSDAATASPRKTRPHPPQNDQDVKKGRKAAVETKAAGRYGQNCNDVSHVGDELRAWLEAAASSIQPEPAAAQSDKPGERFVLILNDLSRSLVESDFYRLAPQGQHVAGWAGGIVKVVQHISTDTREPRGQYFLFFDSRADAAAYRDHIDALLRDPDADLSSFTLLPRGSQLRSSLVSASELSDAVRSINSAPPGPNRSVPYNLPLHLHRDSTGRPLSHFVTVRLTGSKITLETMVKAIEDDGAARNLPWRLADKLSVHPLGPGSAKIAWGQWAEDAPDSAEEVRGYTRFVVPFDNAAEAKRFARVWHKRQMMDDRTERTMVVNATALW